MSGALHTVLYSTARLAYYVSVIVMTTVHTRDHVQLCSVSEDWESTGRIDIGAIHLADSIHDQRYSEQKKKRQHVVQMQKHRKTLESSKGRAIRIMDGQRT